jgi:hypothetical protein
MILEAEFRDAIRVAIPSLIEVLKYGGYYEYDGDTIRFPVASMLAQLSGNRASLSNMFGT